MKKLILCLVALLLLTEAYAYEGWFNPDETIFVEEDSFTLKIPVSKKKIDYNTLMLATPKDGLVRLFLNQTTTTKNFKYRVHERAAADNAEKTGYAYKFRITIERLRGQLSVSRETNTSKIKLYDTLPLKVTLSNTGNQRIVGALYEDILPSYLTLQGPLKVTMHDRSQVFRGPQFPQKITWKGTVAAGQSIGIEYTLKVVSVPPTEQIVLKPATVQYETPVVLLNTSPLKLSFVQPLALTVDMLKVWRIGQTYEIIVTLANLLPSMSMQVDQLTVTQPKNLNMYTHSSAVFSDNSFEWHGTLHQGEKRSFPFRATVVNAQEDILNVEVYAHYFDQEIYYNRTFDVVVTTKLPDTKRRVYTVKDVQRYKPQRRST